MVFMLIGSLTRGIGQAASDGLDVMRLFLSPRNYTCRCSCARGIYLAHASDASWYPEMSYERDATTWPLSAAPLQVSSTRFHAYEDDIDTLFRRIKMALIKTRTETFTLRRPV
jgi:hypothetical protein